MPLIQKDVLLRLLRQISNKKLEPDKFQPTVKFYKSLKPVGSILKLTIIYAKYKKIPLSLKLINRPSLTSFDNSH